MSATNHLDTGVPAVVTLVARAEPSKLLFQGSTPCHCSKMFLFFNFLFMKILLTIIVAVLATVSTVSAAAEPVTGGGGPLAAFNFTTNKVELVPQCFPWTFYSSFLVGNIGDIYTNQEACRAKRFADFGM